MLCFLTASVVAQQKDSSDLQIDPYSINYTIKDGLPSNQVYDVIQDDENFLWIATDRGISKFDGKTFTNYTTVDGLVNNTVFKFIKTPDGTVYYYTISNEIGKIKNGKFYEEPYNSDLKNILGNDIITKMIIDRNGFKYITAYLLGRSGTYVIIKPNGEIEKKRIQRSELGVLVKEIYEDYLTMRSESNYFYYVDSTNSSFKIELKDFISHPIEKHAVRFEDYVIASDRERIFIIDLISKKLIKKISHNTEIFLIRTGPNYLFISTKNGIYKLTVDDLIDKGLSNSYHFLNGNSINNVYLDHEGNSWYSTLDNGLLFVSPNFPNKIELLTPFQFSYSKVEQSQGNNFEVVNGKYLYELDFENRKNKYQLFNSSIKYYANIDQKQTVTFNTYSLFFDDGVLIYDSNNNKTDIIYDYSKSTNFYWIVSRGLLRLKKSEKFKIEFNNTIKLPNSSRLISILALNDSEALVGTTQGVHHVTERNNIFSSKKISIHKLFPRIQSIKKLNDKIILGSLGDGLIVLNSKFEVVQIVTEGEELSSNLVNSIKVGNNNNLFVSSNKGLDEFKLVEDTLKFIRSISKNHGFDLLNCKEVALLDSHLIVNSHQGILSFNLNDSFNNKVRTFAFSPSINNIHLSHVESKDSTFVLKYDHDPIKINFHPIHFNSFEKIELQYKLNNGSWVESNEIVQFPNLNYGKNRIQFRGKYKGSTWENFPKNIYLKVIPPFWATWWFIVLVIAFSIVGVILIILTIIKNKQQKTLLLIENQRSELKALRLQMNPHFLYNVMSSVQYLILKGKTTEAVQAMSSFARMLRKILKYSDNNWITLTEEIELLTDYIQLEKNRVTNGFDFAFSTVANEIRIPPMIIQPFIENSIWHGLEKLTDRKGNLKVEFSINETEITCTIEDNGVGRDIQKQLADEKHQSFGLSLIKRRLSIWDKERSHSKGKKFSYTIIDLKDNLNQPIGTKVIVTMPYEKD